MASKQQHLGSVIQHLRKQASLTQDDLSDKAGLSYSTLAKIERGAIKNPSVFTMVSIATVLNTTVEELINPFADLEVPERKPETSSVKFVYADMNGVLVRFFQRAFSSIADETGLGVDKIETTFWHYNDAANRGDMTIDEFNHAMAEHLGLKRFDWQKHYMAAVEPINEMHKCLHGLKGRVPVGILSNTMPGFIDALRERQYLPDIDYAAVVDSSEVRAIKPEQEIYKMAEKAAGFSGDEILFVDDSRTNLMAAEHFGWRVLWFDDYRPADSVKRVEAALKA